MLGSVGFDLESESAQASLEPEATESGLVSGSRGVGLEPEAIRAYMALG